MVDGLFYKTESWRLKDTLCIGMTIRFLPSVATDLRVIDR